MYTFDKVVKIVIGVAVFLGLYFLVKSISGALLPFLIAWLVAYLMNPLVNFLQHRCRIRFRGVSIVAAFLLLITALTALALLVAPSIHEEFIALRDITLTQLSPEKIASTLNLANSNYPFFEKMFSNWDISQWIANNISVDDWKNIANSLFAPLQSIVSGSVSFVSGIFTFFIVILYIFFILLDFDKISDGSINMIPDNYRDMAQMVISDVQIAMNSYFRGQALVAFLVGVLFSIGFLIIDFPMAIVLGMFIGLLNMVPYLQIIGIAPTLLLSFIKAMQTDGSFFWIFAAAMAVFAVVQIIQDAIIVPKVMGKVTGMNPAVILLSLSIWGALLGIVGMIIALPLTSLLVSYYTRFILKRPKTHIPSDQTPKQEPNGTEIDVNIP